VRFRVLGPEVVAIVGGHQGEGEVLGQFYEGGVNAFLFGQVVILDLDVETVVKDRGVLGGDLARQLITAGRLPLRPRARWGFAGAAR